jgi:hypothetical protein
MNEDLEYLPYQEASSVEEFVAEIEEYIQDLGGFVAIDPQTRDIVGAINISAEVRHKIIAVLQTIVDELIMRSLPDSEPILKLAGSYLKYFRYKSQKHLNRVN